MMATVMCTRVPHKAPELLAYQATIIKAKRNYEGAQRVSYDRQYHRETLARKDLNWSVPDPRLYNEVFIGRARAIPRCSFCPDNDHNLNNCQKNPNRSLLGWFPSMGTWPMPVLPQAPTITQPREACRCFNEGRCNKQQCCKYLQCPQRQPSGCSRSPLHRSPATFPGHASN